MKRWAWLMAIVLGVSMLGFVGCDDDDGDDDDAATTTEGTTAGGTAASGDSDDDAETEETAAGGTTASGTTASGTTTGGTSTGGTSTETTTSGSGNANVSGNWNGVQNYDDNSAHFDVSLTQDSSDVVRGTFTSSDISASGKVGGTVSGLDHVVLTFQYTAGAASGYKETWDGHVNAAEDDMNGTVTPNNGGASGTFALQK